MDLNYEPQPRQALAHGSKARQILYGGAAGGGKSRFLRMDMVSFCLQNPGIECYLFRRTYPELQKNHINRFKTEVDPSLWKYSGDQKRFEFENGSAINCCYCEKEDDVLRYNGAEIHYLGVDEAAHLTEFQLSYLRTRCRLGDWEPDPAFAGFLPRIVFTSNPGGPGHDFLKLNFINPAPAETIFPDATTSIYRKNYPGHPSIYIPAGMSDNKYLEDEYEGQFTHLAPELRDALMKGDWDAVVGKAIHNLDVERHKIRSFKPPAHWTKFQVIDWGTASPFSIGWYVVSEGAELSAKRGYKDTWLPKGAVIRYREWYGWDGPPNNPGRGRPNKGCRLPSQRVARRIIEIERDAGDRMDYRVGDTEMWAQRDGVSVQENMRKADPRMVMRQSHKNRRGNFNEILSRLAGSEEYTGTGETREDPMLFFTENCIHFWRTVPNLTLDRNDPEKGPDTNLEDHVYDAVAYACASRPFVTSEEERYWADHGEEIEKARGAVQDPYATH